MVRTHLPCTDNLRNFPKCADENVSPHTMPLSHSPPRIGMDIELSHKRLTYKMIGGVADLFIFPGPTPRVSFRLHVVLSFSFPPT